MIIMVQLCKAKYVFRHLREITKRTESITAKADKRKG